MQGELPRWEPMPVHVRMGQAPEPPGKRLLPDAQRALVRTQDRRGCQHTVESNCVRTSRPNERGKREAVTQQGIVR